MKERPIIFSGSMVRAILDGAKTQTRRVIKPQPNVFCKHLESKQTAEGFCFGDMVDNYMARCPYGIPGDRLWVRETWQNVADMNICHPADGYVVYRATDPDWETMDGWRWRPSIFMPRSASRILLEITDIRVERVQDISWQNCVKEGYLGDMPMVDGKPWFRKLWNSINAKRGYSWESNPWVWAIEFKRVEEE